eukprot:scaffold4598_cov73-Cyclotella_meneghiniana.AAC.16
MGYIPSSDVATSSTADADNGSDIPFEEKLKIPKLERQHTIYTTLDTYKHPLLSMTGTNISEEGAGIKSRNIKILLNETWYKVGVICSVCRCVWGGR